MGGLGILGGAGYRGHFVIDWVTWGGEVDAGSLAAILSGFTYVVSVFGGLLFVHRATVLLLSEGQSPHR